MSTSLLAEPELRRGRKRKRGDHDSDDRKHSCPSCGQWSGQAPIPWPPGVVRGHSGAQPIMTLAPVLIPFPADAAAAGAKKPSSIEVPTIMPLPTVSLDTQQTKGAAEAEDDDDDDDEQPRSLAVLLRLNQRRGQVACLACAEAFLCQRCHQCIPPRQLSTMSFCHNRWRRSSNRFPVQCGSGPYCHGCVAVLRVVHTSGSYGGCHRLSGRRLTTCFACIRMTSNLYTIGLSLYPDSDDSAMANVDNRQSEHEDVGTAAKQDNTRMLTDEEDHVIRYSDRYAQCRPLRATIAAHLLHADCGLGGWLPFRLVVLIVNQYVLVF